MSDQKHVGVSTHCMNGLTVVFSADNCVDDEAVLKRAMSEDVLLYMLLKRSRALLAVLTDYACSDSFSGERSELLRSSLGTSSEL